MANLKMLLLTILLFSIASFIRQGIVGAHVLYMDKEFNNTMLTLKCAVDTYVSEIRFTFPNNKTDYAYCVVPFKSDTQCYCSCNSNPTCKCTISQNILTKITTLQISDTELTGVFGWYSCSHGSYNKSIIVARPVLLLDKEVSIDMIKLNCTAEEFISRIDFFFPSNFGHAYCIKPSPAKMKCYCSCNSSDTCNCSTTQDPASKTTTLLIVDNDLTGMFGWYTCALGSYKKSIIVSKPVLRLETEVNDTMITLNCATDELTSRIYFVFPNNNLGHGYCNAPKPSYQPCNCSCSSMSACECEITQDTATKTTTLQIRDNDLTNMFGLYTCVHGFHNKSAMVARFNTFKQNNAECEKSTVHGAVLSVSLLIMTGAIGFIIFICVFPDILGRIKKVISRYYRGIQDLTGNLQFKEHIECAICKAISICALCVQCRNYYCDPCCVHHTESNSDHIVFQIQHIAANQKKVLCKMCAKISDRFCKICWNDFCTSCTPHHPCGTNGIITIYQADSECRRQKSVEAQEQLTYLYTIRNEKLIKSDMDTDPVRICGICYLADDMVVIGDGNNQNMIAFKTGEIQMQQKLENEPNAMTAMTGNEFAVTFPYQRYIKTYQLILNSTTNTYTALEINTIDTPGKPFSIAYNHKKFAVEIGEGEDGFFIIYDIDHKVISKPMKCKFSFFTGHTIRLALNRNRIFVSATGRKMVICYDLEGNKIWHQSIPGPRAIIVPEDDSLVDKIVLSSRRCNAIYTLDKKNGNYEILKAKINSPRYMGYNSVTKTLCVLVMNEVTFVDELAFFKFKDIELNESLSLENEAEQESMI